MSKQFSSTPVPVAKSVLLDTSFLITVFDQNRPNHAQAEQMYFFFIRHGFIMYLSSIVVSEFCVKGDIQDLPLANFLPLGFDMADGVEAGRLNFKDFLPAGGDRAGVKDDVKLVAQAVKNGIRYFATEDRPLAEKLLAAQLNILPIFADDRVDKHFMVTTTADGTVVSRASLPGQMRLFAVQ